MCLAARQTPIIIHNNGSLSICVRREGISLVTQAVQVIDISVRKLQKYQMNLFESFSAAKYNKTLKTCFRALVFVHWNAGG